jgi:hypothetical protein
MTSIIRRACRIIVAPAAEWPVVAAENPNTSTLLCRFVLPLAIIPAAGWSLGVWLFNHAGGGADGLTIARAGLTVVIGVLLWVCLSAALMMLSARWFNGARSWLRALQVAAYSLTPVLLSGLLLALADLMAVWIIALFHSFYLQFVGVQPMLGIKPTDAAEFVAVNTMALMVMSSIIGALATSLRLL